MPTAPLFPPHRGPLRCATVTGLRTASLLALALYAARATIWPNAGGALGHHVFEDAITRQFHPSLWLDGLLGTLAVSALATQFVLPRILDSTGHIVQALPDRNPEAIAVPLGRAT